MKIKDMGTITTPEEKMDAALEVLDQARKQILALIDGISQADSERRPGPDQWSVGEIAQNPLLDERLHRHDKTPTQNEKEDTESEPCRADDSIAQTEPPPSTVQGQMPPTTQESSLLSFRPSK